MDHFWPTLPLVVPGSEGMPLWWGIAWWVFQIVVMTFILVLIARWAAQVDRNMGVDTKDHVSDSSQQPPVQS